MTWTSAIHVLLLPVLAVVLAYLLVCGLYLDMLVVAASRYTKRSAAGPATHTVTLMIPAHDESAGIGATLARVAELEYPAGLLRTVVIADNCTDDTATRARAAGAEVWERSDLEHPGKGPALRWAIERLGPARPGQAVAVLDADSEPSADWIRRAEARLRGGEEAVQSYYGLSNETSSRRTRLMGVALLIFHHVRPAGREVLGLSAGLKGNGMVFASALLERVPWDAFSVTEDLEYASILAMNGVRVAYDGGSRVLGPAGLGKGAQSQRLRWEGGRFGVTRRWAGPLLFRAVRHASLLQFDSAMELIVQPLGLLVMLNAVAAIVAAAGLALGAVSAGWLVLAVVALALFGLHVVGGLLVARAPARSYATLLTAPGYIAWKLVVYFLVLTGVQRAQWGRTERG